MLEEGDQEEPINRGEEVYREAQGVVQVVLIGQTEIAEPGTRSRFLGELIQRPNRRLVTMTQVTQQTEEQMEAKERHPLVLA